MLYKDIPDNNQVTAIQWALISQMQLPNQKINIDMVLILTASFKVEIRLCLAIEGPNNE